MYATTFSSVEIASAIIYYLCVDKSNVGVTAQWLADCNVQFNFFLHQDHAAFYISGDAIEQKYVDQLDAKFNPPDEFIPEFCHTVNGTYELTVSNDKAIATTQWLESKHCLFDRYISEQTTRYKFAQISDSVVQAIASKYNLDDQFVEVIIPVVKEVTATQQSAAVEFVNSIDKQSWLVSFFVKDANCNKNWTEGGMHEATLVKTELYEEWYLAIRNAINWKDATYGNTYAINELWPGIDPLDSQAALDMDNDIQVLQRVLRTAA